METQTNKRMGRFLLHKATEENIDASSAKIVIRTDNKKVFTLLLNGNKIVSYIPIKEVTAFFGRQHNDFNTQAIIAYLNKLAKTEEVEVIRISLVICQNKGEYGTHLYIDTTYKKPVSTVDFLTHFNTLV
jgi:hypothetical protein